MGFDYNASNGRSFTRFGLFPHLVYNFSDEWAESPYLRLGAGMQFTDIDTRTTDDGFTTFGIGGGAGIRLLVTEQLAARFEAAVNHWFETDEAFGYNQLQLLAGLSLFVN